MPRLPSAQLVAQIQDITEEFFYSDTASILQDTVDSLGVYGNPSVTTTTTSISCSYTDKPNKEKWKGYADIEMISSEIRFSSPAPAKGNRVTLTGMYDGTGFVDKTFEIIGIKDRDAFGYMCALMAVQI